MKRLMLAVLLCGTAALTAAQDRSAELDQAYEEARAAYVALKEAEARRDQGIEPQPGERLGLATGGTRASEEYLARQARLEQEVELTRQRHEAAQKRWSDLK